MNQYLRNTIVLLLISVSAMAQVDTVRLNKYYLKKYWNDTKTIVRSPVRWDKTDWQKFGLVAATTGALLLADKPVRNWAQERRSGFLDNTTKYGLEPFDIEYTLAVCGALYGYGLLAKNRKLESTALLAAESYVLASVFVRIPKTLLGRQRPNDNPDVTPFNFKGPFNGDGFPSGHTIAVFSVASVIANQYQETVWIPALSYSIATLIGLSRIYDNRHWTSDVFAGAVMGIAIGNMVCPRNKDSRISIIPVKMDSVYGVRLALTL